MKRDSSADDGAEYGSSTDGDHGELLEADSERPDADSEGVVRERDATRGGTTIDVPADLPVDPTSLERVTSIAETALRDPVSAGDRIGDLLVLAREHEGEVRETAGEVLNLLGLLRPAEFAVWRDDLASIARSSDDRIAFYALRALAQLAGDDARAASSALDVAFDHVEAPRTEMRQAALSIVAEVGGERPDLVRRADRHVMAALVDPDPGVRLAGAITAGKLLGAAPGTFPRTATVLLEALDDDCDAVWEYAHVALVHFAREHPEQVPEKKRAIERLGSISDEDLGVREGATKDALTRLLSLEYDLDL